jgi:hypothetical protein
MKQAVNEHDAALVDAWLDGQLEGQAAAALSERLAARQADDADLLHEEAQLRRLFEGIELGKLGMAMEVRPGFADAVMARLPRRAKASRLGLGLAAAAALAGLAAAVALLAPGASTVGSLSAALADYVAALALAGAGLLGASWRGVGDGVRSFLALSPANLAMVVGVFAASCLLLFALLRRRRAAVTARSQRPRG